MKLFTQLALVTAIAASGSAYAMQTMDDSTLGNTTGQDGLTISVTTPAAGLTIDQIAVYDHDGVVGGATEAGAIVLGQNATRGSALGSDPSASTLNAATNAPFNINTGGGSITLVIDATGGGAAGANTGTKPMINVAVTLPTTFTVTTGSISVVGAQGAAGAQQVDTASTSPVAPVLNSMTLALGGLTANIQLGNTAQGGMILIGGTLASGLTVTGFGLNDATTGAGGTLAVGSIKLTGGSGASFNNTTLVLNSTIDIDSAANYSATFATPLAAGGGLVIAGPAGVDKYNAYLTAVNVNGTGLANIGDVGITGLNLGSGTKIGIQGH